MFRSRTDDPARIPTPGLWRHRSFLSLWGAQGISAIGSQITLLAMPLTAILVLNASAFHVALMSAASTVPFLLLGIPAGVWIDRLQRLPVMIVSDLGRALMLFSVPIAYVVGHLNLPHLYVVAIVNGSLSVMFDVASQAYLPSVVAREYLVEANAKFEASRVVAQAAGPGGAGGLVSLVGAPVALLADAISFVASAGLLLSSPRRKVRPPPAQRLTGSKLRELREGARYTLGHRLLRPLLLAHSSANLTLGLVWSIVIIYAVREFGLTGGVVGVVLSLGQVGGLAGALLGRRMSDWLGVGRAVVVGFFLFGPATLMLAAAPRSAAIAFLSVGWAVANFPRAIYGICATSVRQAIVPDRLQGRVTGFLGTAGVGAFPLGAAIGGVLASGVGLREAMVIGAIISFLPCLPLALSPMWSLRDVDAARDEPVEETDATPA